MKKTLVAIAALAATGAFAQVTITGNFDAGYSSLNAKTDTSDKKEIIANGSSTSLIKFAGTEDLGGGLKAEFVGVQLINPISGQTGNTNTDVTSTPQNKLGYNNSNWFNDEIWVGVSGGFGAVKLGAPNAGMHETNSKSQPFGTALGGGWSSSGINRLGLGGATGAVYGVNQFLGGASANGRVVRAEKSVRYDTPTFNGFNANIVYAAKNANQTDAEKVASNSNGFTNYTLNYSNGPLNLAYSVAEVKAGAYVAAGNNDTGSLTANDSVKYTFAAANYTVGAVTVYGGLTTGKSTGLSTDFEVKSSNVAVKYAVSPTVDVLANTVKVSDKVTATAKDQSLMGLSAIYKFSKRTSAYATYQKYDTDKSSATKANEATQTIVGLRHQF